VKLIAPLTVGNRARSGSPTRFRVNEHRTRTLMQLHSNFSTPDTFLVQLEFSFALKDALCFIPAT
jgi:hypothetical protein